VPNKYPDVEPENLSKCSTSAPMRSQDRASGGLLLGTMVHDMAVADYSLNLPVLLMKVVSAFRRVTVDIRSGRLK
jgi:hypothetical protein